MAGVLGRLSRRGMFVMLAAAPMAVSALDPVPCPQGTACDDLPIVILRIINYVLALVGVIALAFIIYGGFTYITSGGNEDRVESAKGMIVNAVIGVVVIGIAAALVNFVVRAVGGGVPAGVV